MNTTLNYSPNFDEKKRRVKQIKFVIFHYTGMKRENDAIKKLTSEKSKVSCHYLIKSNGEILMIVPELYIAWHAGISFWKQYKLINKFSIGIELSNPGHEHNYKKFPKKQINSLIKLSKFLIRKYKIKPSFFLGHSDIAVDRKKDPGEKFPWKYLSKKKIGLWHDLNQNFTKKKRNIDLKKNEKLKFFKNLAKIGYPKIKFIYETKYTKLITKAFQRRFRQELINGTIDLECLLISNNIAKKIK
jgi:N-acetylmuramoyl-L-alanine amidase